MKIAFFSDTYFPQVNGVVNVTHHLAESLAKRGHEVWVFTVSRESPKSLQKRLRLPYTVVTVPSLPIPLYPGERFTLPFAFPFAEIEKIKPDIIHTHTPFSMGQSAYKSAKRLGVPLVGTHHTFFDHYLKLWYVDYPWTRSLSWKITNAYYNKCTMVVSPTQALARAMQTNGLTAPLTVLQNPVQLAKFTPRAAWRAEENTASIVYMGRVSREKDADKVLEAYIHLVHSEAYLQSEKKVRLVIIGDGLHRKELEQKAAEAGLGEQVEFTGFLKGEALSDELREHDVFITASKSENMPISVLEAMASGLPVVAVDALGMPEIVRHEENGFIVAPDDTAAMAEQLLKIITDSDLQKKFARASREFAQRHDPEVIASLHEELYQRLLQQSQ